MDDPVKNINTNIFSNNEQKILAGTKETINYCKMLLSEIKNKNIENTLDVKFIKHIMADHMYIAYYCFKCIGIMKLVSKSKVLCDVDLQMENYLDNFFSQKTTYNIFSDLRKKANDDERIFYDNMIEKCSKYQKHPEVQKKIKDVTDQITNCLDEIEGEHFDVPLEMKKYLNCDKIILNRKNYYYLQKRIPDASIRKYIENSYLSKSDRCLGLLEKLVVLRTDYANKMKCDTYFDITKDKQFGSAEIFNLINNHVIKLNNRSMKETKMIYDKLDKLEKRKVEIHDFIYYGEMMASKYVFALEHVLNVIFDVVKGYFSITFEQVKTKDNLWKKFDIRVYKMYDSHQMCLGYIYMDLLNDVEKTIASPLCIHMCQEYTDLNNNNYVSQVCIIAGYENYDKKTMKYIDVIALFKEIGNSIQFLMYQTKTGHMILNDEFYSLTSKIMEYIFWERTTLEKLCDDRQNIVDDILMTKCIDYANSIKLKCINAYFDLLIHSSPTLAVELKKSGQYDGKVLKNIYTNTFENVMSSQKNIFEIHADLVHPIVILQEVNGTESKVYESVIIEILSFNLFSAIKNNHGKTYIKILSKAHAKKFKDLLDQFVEKYGDNYDSYSQEVFGCNEIQNNKKNGIIMSRKLK